MDFKRKLERMPAPGANLGAARMPPAAGPTNLDSESNDLEPATHRGSTLELLRRKMAALLERAPAIQRRAHQPPDLTELSFLGVETASGVLHRRCHRLPPSHHVGRIPVDAARDARTELLALLALDPTIAGRDLGRALFIDTETTGLGGAGVVAFLIGLAWFDPDRALCLEQFLLPSPAHELPLLQALSERVHAADVLVSYNGKSFDLPLLAGRLVMNRLPALPPRAHMDLLHVGRRLHRKRLGACRLVTLESEVLGFVRGPDIEGGEIAARYAHFLRSGDTEALRSVVEHNAWDVLSMAALVGLYGEPFDLLHPEDLVGLSRTLKRARALDEAERAVNTALDRGAGSDARKLRGAIHKARGDRASALSDFEALLSDVDDAEVRLELAKLYEHFLGEPLRALELVELGTGESAASDQRRRERLRKKLAKPRRKNSAMRTDSMAYDHRTIEPRWQKYWEEHQTFRAERRPGRPKIYVLDMFPYPSGTGLHMGHPEGYTASDIVARYKRMQGFDVLHPMGWDAFGLPAEQHAIETGTHPKQTTVTNINTLRRQLKSLGFAYDWSRELDTTDPGYVRWTQWIFLQLFKRGLAFQAEIPVNWCPELGTVLANEEVIDGRSERGNHPVIRLPLRQWQLRITAYADRLAADLSDLDWPETKQKQRDWIGRSEGAEVDFPIVGHSEMLKVYTTRPDTLFGATYMVIAPDHRLTLGLTAAAEKAAVSAYIEAAARKSDLERTALNKEKSGIFIGAYATNPLNQQRIPIFTADYVLGAYGTGAIMAVPGHDERDFEFAKKFDLPIVEVVSPDGTLHPVLERPYADEGVAVRSGEFDGLPTAVMMERMIAALEQRGIGRRQVNYKLRDWVFSRQRYWGEPIPIYFPVRTAGDPRRGDAFEIDYNTPIPLEESELPLRLPELEDYQPGDPQGPLARALEWRFFQRSGSWFARETNTMPQWAGSCWYYLRYLDPKNDQRPFDRAEYDAWMPVDLYIGGSEHAVLHLLYARFWHKVLFDMGLVTHAEPFQKLVHQGTVLGTSYRWYAVVSPDGSLARALAGDDGTVVQAGDEGLKVAKTGEKVEERWVMEAEVTWREGKPLHPSHGVALVAVAEKMSKSRGNSVSPDSVVDEFGADSLRVYEMFMGPLEQSKPWQSSGLQGVRRFLDRVHNLAARPLADAPLDAETAKLLHRTVKKVGEDIEALRLNTAVSAMMILANHLNAISEPPREAVEKLILCLAPFAPHVAEELWERTGHPPSVSGVAWPGYDPQFCVDDVIEIAVQINGKVRGRAELARDASEAEARAAAQADPHVARFLEGKTVKKLIYVPGKIINFIAG